MSWVRLDDGFFTHPKVIDLPALAKLLFIGCLCHCSHNRTDGFVSSKAMRLVALATGAPTKATGPLVTAGLLERSEGGWRVHDYTDYQLTASDHRARAESGRVGGLRSGASRRSKNEANASAGGEASALENSEAHVEPLASSSLEAKPPISLEQTPPQPSSSKPVPEDSRRGFNDGSGTGRNLTERAIAACSGRNRERVRTEAGEVIAHLQRFVDDRLIDEAIGHAEQANPNLPRWLLPVVRASAERVHVVVPPMTGLEAR